MRHRSDIDGLRALAVIPIVLFHAGASAIPGGFTGVDVFFVISGFLITSIIHESISEGTFSLAEFYKRRAVRIFPVLFLMLGLALVFARFMLLPTEVDAAVRGAVATSLFVSNIYFFTTTDYFGPAAEYQPFLHTWSLGVEEQFYVVYPLLMLLLKRVSAARFRAVLWTIVLVSFVGAWRCWQGSSAGVFYLLPARAWELALGGLVALGGFPPVRRKVLSHALSAIGLLAIAAALVVIDQGMSFPSPWALLPAGGTALLIAYGPSTAVAAFLSTLPMRGIGKLSYSLYLWHWPIITFYRLRTHVSLSPVEGALLVLASFVAACCSYVLVERPFLQRFRTATPKLPLVCAAAAIASLLVGASIVWLTGANWRSHPPEVQRIAAYGDYRSLPVYQFQFRRGECFISLTGRENFDKARCLAVTAERPNVVVLGDSHAAQYWRAFSLRFAEMNVMQATASGCRPTLPAQGAERCAAIVSYVLGPMVERGELDWVILGGRWHGADLPGVDNAIRSLQARRVPVTVIGPGVEYDGETPLLLIRAMLESNFDQMDRHRNAERKALSDHLRSVVAQAGGDYVSAYDLECPGGRCALFDSEGGPFHFDYGHLTLAAARQIVNGIHPPQALETIDGDTPHWRVAERRQNSASARTLPSSSSRR